MTDFGLSRARSMTMADGEDPTGTIMVDRVGMTPAYASPEQAAGQSLTRRTDIWSWAVSVLEMFTGEATWPMGAAAGLALETYLEIEPHHIEATYNRGLLKWRAGKIADVDLLTDLREVCLSHAETWLDEYYLGLVHMERGDFEAAVEVLESIQGADGEQPQVFDALSLARKKAGELMPEIIDLDQTRLNDWGIRSAFSQDGRHVIITYHGKSKAPYTAVFSTEDGRLVSILNPGPGNLGRGELNTLFRGELSPDGKFAATGDHGGFVVLWDTESERIVSRFHRRDTGPADNLKATSMCIAKDGKRVFVGYRDLSLKEWDAVTGECTGEFVSPIEPSPVNAILHLELNEEHGLLLSKDFYKQCILWDIKTRACLKCTDKNGNLKFSHQGRYLLEQINSDKKDSPGPDSDSDFEIIDLDNNVIASERIGFDLSGSVSPCGKFDVTTTPLTLWETGSGRCLRTFGLLNRLNGKADWFRWRNEPGSVRFSLAVNLLNKRIVKKAAFDNVQAPFMFTRALASEETLRHQEAYKKISGKPTGQSKKTGSISR